MAGCAQRQPTNPGPDPFFILLPHLFLTSFSLLTSKYVFETSNEVFSVVTRYNLSLLIVVADGETQILFSCVPRIRFQTTPPPGRSRPSVSSTVTALATQQTLEQVSDDPVDPLIRPIHLSLRQTPSSRLERNLSASHPSTIFRTSIVPTKFSLVNRQLRLLLTGA